MTTGKVVVTDLDGTLIYSRAGGGAGVVVDAYANGRFGVTTEGVVRGLAALGSRKELVVATSRTPRQYLRLRLGSEPPLALVSNGARLLVGGREDRAWHDSVLSEHVAAEGSEVVALVGRVTRDSTDIRLTLADWGLAVLVASEPRVIATLAESVEEAVAELGWVAHATGRKLHLIPRMLDKGHMVSRLIRELGSPRWCTAGDTSMDAGILRAAELGLVPRGGEVWNQVAHLAHVEQTHGEGLAAADEITERFLRFVSPQQVARVRTMES